MGGEIAWTLRLENGTEYRMKRWTNIFPHVLMDLDFLAGDPVSIQGSLQNWLDMKQDWEAKTFVNHMTKTYAPYPFGLRPAEYGLIVTDFVTKTIVSFQRYTGLTHCTVEREMINPAFAEALDIYGEPYAESYAAVRRWYEAGCVLGYKDGAQCGIAGVETLPDLIASATKTRSVGYFILKPPFPWKLYHFNGSDPTRKQDYAFVREKIKELGFVLTDKEERGFDGWIRR